jgi:hypothetical protein
MSHTDKDDPFQIRARRAPDADEIHVFCDRDLPPGSRACDIDDRHGRCHFYSGGEALREGPTPEACHTFYYGPERARVRDALRAARRDHNAHGDTDIEPAPRPHRHRLRDDWW